MQNEGVFLLYVLFSSVYVLVFSILFLCVCVSDNG